MPGFWHLYLLLNSICLGQERIQLPFFPVDQGIAYHAQVYDVASGMLIVHGGELGPDFAFTRSNIVFRLANANGLSQSVWQQLNLTNGPALRRHTAVLDSAANRIVYYGGLAVDDSFSGAVWALNGFAGATPTWTQLPASGPAPPPRVGHTAVFDPASKRMIVFGGYTTGYATLNDLWIADLSQTGAVQWTRIETVGAKPDPRSLHSAVFDEANNRMIIFGADAWVLENATGVPSPPVWRKLNVPAGQQRQGHSAIYDALKNRMVIFAGQTSGSTQGDDYVVLLNANGLGGEPTWMPTYFTEPQPYRRPRNGIGASFDPVSRRLIAVGGFDILYDSTAHIRTDPSAVGYNVITRPGGLQVGVDGLALIAPRTFFWQPGTVHKLDAPAPCTTPPCNSFRFTDWNGQQEPIIFVTVPDPPVTYAANYAVRVQATGIPAEGGRVELLPASADGFYAVGQQLTVQVVPNINYRLLSLSPITVDPERFIVPFSLTVAASFAACTLTPSSRGAAAGAGEEIGTLNFDGESGCTWQASTSDPWITIRGATRGSIPARLNYQLSPNTAPTSRTGTIAINGTNFTITQAGAGCTAAIVSPGGVLPSGASTMGVAVQGTAGCLWPVASSVSWIQPQQQVGTANLSVVSNVLANTGALRTGSLNVAGNVLAFIQPSPFTNQRFTDVPSTNAFFLYVQMISDNAFTQGCSATTFCPDRATTRGEMAVFLVRALLRTNTFRFPETPYFTDVPSTHPLFAYIQKLRELGITAGCTATEYCPDLPVTRGQMAALIIRSKLNLQNTDVFPFAPTAAFTDVPTTHLFFPFVQKLKQLGITSGCTATAYCDTEPVTRAQMATFIVRAFLTP